MLKNSSYERIAKDRPQVLQKNRGYGVVFLLNHSLNRRLCLFFFLKNL